MLELDRVGKVFGRSRGTGAAALESVSLEAAPGECLAVVGPNGAGKSTLLSLVLGFDRPTSGRIRLEGGNPVPWIRRHGASYLPEGFRVDPRIPARECLVRHALLDGLRGAELEARVEASLRRTGLAAAADRPAGTLSKGSLQRLGLALLLACPRRLIVLDEPASGLDPVWRARLPGLLEQLRDRHPAPVVLLASHDLGAVTRSADRVAVLARGRLRTVMDLRSQEDGAGYRLRLRGEADPRSRLPGATPGVEPGSWRVPAADAASLRDPLRRLLGAGAVLEELVPERRDLVDVVQRACDEAAEDDR